MYALRNIAGISVDGAGHSMETGEVFPVFDRVRWPRRRRPADEYLLLIALAEQGLAPLGFAFGAAVLLFTPGTSAVVRFGVSAVGALALALLAVPLYQFVWPSLVRPLATAAGVGALSALILWAGTLLGFDPGSGPGPLALILGSGTGLAALLAAALAGWLGRREPAQRRVLLIDATHPKDVVAALGGAPFQVLGSCRSDDTIRLQQAGEVGIDDVVVAHPLMQVEMAALSWYVRDASVHIYALASKPEPDSSLRPHFVHYRRSNMSPAMRLLKRTIDVVCAGLALCLASPLLLVCAGLIKASSPGPVFFRQDRVGLRGTFSFIKFRTMRQGAHLEHETLIRRHGNHFKLRADSRVHPIGRFLRRFSIDELPQLLLVFTGHMSLVGPRPPMIEEVARYSPSELRRLGYTPGLTGLWQVSGRADLPFAEWVALDAQYIERWSSALELSILLATPRAVFGGKGAY